MEKEIYGYFALNVTYIDEQGLDVSNITTSDISQNSLSLAVRAMTTMVYLAMIFMVKNFYFQKKKKVNVTSLFLHLTIMTLYCLSSLLNSISMLIPCVEFFYMLAVLRSAAHFYKNLAFFRKSQKMYNLISSELVKYALNVCAWTIILANIAFDFLAVYLSGVKRDTFGTCLQYATNFVDVFSPILNAFTEMYFVAAFLLPPVLKKNADIAKFLFQVRNDGILYLALSVIVSIVTIIAGSIVFNPIMQEILRLISMGVSSVCLVFDNVYFRRVRNPSEKNTLVFRQKWNIILAVLLCVLTVLGQALIQGLLRDQLNGFSKINIAGRQRMLSQRITAEMQDVFRYYTLDPASDVTPYLTQMGSSISLFSKSHYGLINGDEDLGLGPEEDTFFLDKFTNLQPMFDSIVGYAETTSDRMVNDPLSVNQTYVSEQIYANRRPFLVLMNNITVSYANSSIEKINSTLQWEWIIFFACLLIVLIIIAMIVKPLLHNRRGFRGKDTTQLTLISVYSVLLFACIGVIQLTFSKQAEDSIRINIAGRQRMLSQRLVAEIYDCARFETYSVDNEEMPFINTLGNTLNLWTSSQNALIHGDNAFAMFAEEDYRFLVLFENLQPYMDVMDTTVQDIISRFPSEPPTDAEMLLLEQNRKIFLPLMNAITNKYEQRGQQELSFLIAILAILLVMVLTVLIFYMFSALVPTEVDQYGNSVDNSASGSVSSPQSEAVTGRNKSMAADRPIRPEIKS